MKPKNPEFVWSVVLTVGTLIVITIWGPSTPDNNPLTKAKLIIAYAGLVLIFLMGFFILAAIASGKIPIDNILAEKDGSGASMSRFQLMVFTFVVAVSFFVIVICRCEYPQVPSGVLTLLGISATTYGVSKAIQSGASDGSGGGNGNGGGGGNGAGIPPSSTTTTTTSTTTP